MNKLNLERFTGNYVIQLVWGVCTVHTFPKMEEWKIRESSFVNGELTVFNPSKFDAEEWLMNQIKVIFVRPKMLSFDDTIFIGRQEDDNGNESENGKFYAEYEVKILINGLVVNRDELPLLFPNIWHTGIQTKQ